ncbi:GFA family protein [Brevundimonas sp.]|uniref:GFA family protein n=1 Tax=Brevundimonas sp. TaxID=1871086 RepID=UPI002731A178|nr:GFA family protein [Brevundimonas sp.]MDP1911743.1 GFA family protein [Brevundimonas sp.]
MAEVKTHKGGCRCGAVAYEVDSDLDGLIECNCSHCYRKGLVLAFVTQDAFRLTADGAQTEYLFNTNKITHLSCETCGVQSFAHGVAPNGQPMMAVNIRTLTDIEPFGWTAQRVDGRSF